MPVADADRTNVGVLGLEAVHEWHGPASTLRLNTPLRAGFPRYYVKDIGGLHDRPDADDERDPLVGRIGEAPRPSLKRGKTVTYEGRIEALDLRSRRLARRALLVAFDDEVGEEFEMRAIPDPDYAAGTEHRFTARCTAASCPESADIDIHGAPSPYVAEFTIVLRQSDPRYYDWRQRSIEVAGGSPLSVLNDGTAPTDPVLEVVGPANAGVLRVARTTGRDGGRHLELTLPAALGTGEVLTVDWATSSMTRSSDGLDLAGLLTLDSDWWDAGVPGLYAGTNTVQATGAAVQPATVLRVRWRDADW